MSEPNQGSRTLAFQGVCVRFGARTVLDDVSFEVAPGELVGLVLVLCRSVGRR